jgi:hypothetical protein
MESTWGPAAKVGEFKPAPQDAKPSLRPSRDSRLQLMFAHIFTK